MGNYFWSYGLHGNRQEGFLLVIKPVKRKVLLFSNWLGFFYFYFIFIVFLLLFIFLFFVVEKVSCKTHCVPPLKIIRKSSSYVIHNARGEQSGQVIGYQVVPNGYSTLTIKYRAIHELLSNILEPA